MPRPRSPFRAGIALDAGLALAVTALELSDVFVFNSGDRRDLLTVALLLASALPLLAWRRWPFVTIQVTGWATIALAARHATHVGLGPIAATYAVASWSDSKTVRTYAAVTLAIAVWLVPVLTGDDSSIPTNAALFGAAWILGALMRDRRRQTAALQERTVELAREREEKAALAAETERARIARELHDVLTHSVSVMVIQAQAAQAAEPDPVRMATALQRIETIGQQALTDLRGLLRQVRPSQEAARSPQPGVERIAELVDAVRGAGVEVSLSREGEIRTVPPSVGLSAYRIVQEALTNTIRHTPGAHARVALRYGAAELAIEVRDDGPDAVRAPAADGRGIVGMRERASAVGGTLVAGPCPEGGFHVVASLPLRPTA
jgi:signal transduction histidine kinase